jgi:hypothetical protein
MAEPADFPDVLSVLNGCRIGMVSIPTSDDVGPVVGRHRPCACLPLADIAIQALIFGVLMTCF